MPRAYVALSEGKQASERQIQKWMEQYVTRHKYLTGGVKFVDAIPKNAVSSSCSLNLYQANIWVVWQDSAKSTER